MAKSAVDHEYLSDVWTRIDSVFSEQKVAKYKVAERCGFSRKTLIARTNISITYFARLCKELNVSADFFLFGLEKEKDLEKEKEKTSKATYSPDKCYKDIPTQQEIIKEAKKMMKHKGNGISINNSLGISAQRELMTLADDFDLLHREDVQEIIENCKSYEEGQKEIMRVYEKVYM